MRFTARSGEVVEHDTGNDVEPVEPGDMIRVVYDRDDPYTFQHEKWGYSRDLVALCVVIGVAVFAWGLTSPRAGFRHGWNTGRSVPRALAGHDSVGW